MQGSQAKILAYVDKFAERQDVVLAVFILALIFMLIIPLPTQLIDVLIAFNISCAVILLMVAVYLKSPLDFAAFPSVLLITTLFRLAISISTTRLILLQADAGKIVETFGKFVVGGNLIVGLVIFLILTIVQFIVITKGSERVAEVSARFSLDALPGKQLSIDADMRAGAIDNDQARAMRGRIQRESKLYGSMDGAMKFVKGDAIAGLIIVVVNLIGGLGIGMLQRGIEFGEAIRIYSILTIGDGLISQIPALFISVCAGIIVTRVADEGDASTNLGRDIGKQVGAEPRALIVAGAMLIVFALLPGFPTVTFLVLAAVFAVPSLLLVMGRRRRARKQSASEVMLRTTELSRPEPKEDAVGFSSSRDDIFVPTIPLLVELPDHLAERSSGKTLAEEINAVRVNLYYRLGVPLPVIEVRSSGRADNRYRIFFGEIPASQGTVLPDHVFVFDRTDNLDLYGIAWEEGENFLPRADTIWVRKEHVPMMKGVNIRFRDGLSLVSYHAELVFARYTPALMDVQTTRFLIGRMEQNFADLVKEVQRVLSIQVIAELLRRLVSEFVSIRDLRLIFGAMVEWGSREKDPIMLVEHIRSAMARQISYQHAAGNNVLSVYMLDSDVEEAVRNAIRQTSSGSYLALPPETSQAVLDELRRVGGDSLKGDNIPPLITSMDVRRYIRRLIETEFPEMAVLSYQEIVSEIALQPIDRIAMPRSVAAA